MICSANLWNSDGLMKRSGKFILRIFLKKSKIAKNRKIVVLGGLVEGVSNLLRRKWGVFLLGRRLVFRSAQEMIPFSARNRLGAPSAQEFGRFSAREAGGIPFCAGIGVFFCS